MIGFPTARVSRRHDARGIRYFFFFSSRRRHTRLQGDWSSDVCSSDLGEAIEKTLTGSILWVTFQPTIIKLAAVYAALGLFHYALRHRFLTISFHPEEAERLGWRIKWWDFLFYLSFGVVITLAVPVAGVLMVFSFLVVPAVIAFLFTRDMKRLAYISWGSGALASVLGLWLSLAGDLPTGPLIVCMYGVVLVGAIALRKLMRAPV